MSLHGQYDTDNIFAKIMRREMSCVRVYEDGNILAIMDAFPQSEGHVLVMPKAPSRNLLETHAKDIGRLFGTTQRIAAAVKSTLNPDGIRIMQFNGAPAGQTVFHTHVHIIPCYEGKAHTPHAEGGMADAKLLQSLADKIKSAL